jgi:hypothetical protein
MDCPRVAIVSGASTALEASKTARASLKCYERTPYSMVYLITIRCGATKRLSNKGKADIIVLLLADDTM